MTFEIGPEHAAVQLAATLVFADAGAQSSRIRLYTEPNGTGTLLAEISLDKPCGTLASGVITLHPATTGGTMVVATGIPRSGRWISGDDLLVAVGTVTDMDNDGDFKIGGGNTTAGDNSPTLYAGGLVVLGTLTLT